MWENKILDCFWEAGDLLFKLIPTQSLPLVKQKFVEIRGWLNT